MSVTTSTRSSTSGRLLPRRGRRVVTVVGAAVVGALTWWVAVRAGGGAPVVAVAGDTRSVGAVDVVGAALTAGLGGWAGVALLERVAPASAMRWWVVAAVAVVLLSLLGPLAATTPGGVFGLLALHATVGLSLLFGLRPGYRG